MCRSSEPFPATRQVAKPPEQSLCVSIMSERHSVPPDRRVGDRFDDSLGCCRLFSFATALGPRLSLESPLCPRGSAARSRSPAGEQTGGPCLIPAFGHRWFAFIVLIPREGCDRISVLLAGRRTLRAHICRAVLEPRGGATAEQLLQSRWSFSQQGLGRGW